MNDGWICINTIWHKIGLHGKVFMLIEGEWIRSTKTVADLMSYTKQSDKNGYHSRVPEITTNEEE